MRRNYIIKHIHVVFLSYPPVECRSCCVRVHICYSMFDKWDFLIIFCTPLNVLILPWFSALLNSNFFFPIHEPFFFMLFSLYLSVADPDVYPGSWFLSIPDPKTATKEGWKKILYLFCSRKFYKIILFLKCWRKKLGPIFKELYNFLPKKLSLRPQNMGLGSEIRDPGVKKAPDHGSATLLKLLSQCLCGHKVFSKRCQQCIWEQFLN